MSLPSLRWLRERAPRHVARFVGHEYAAWPRSRELGPSIDRVRARSIVPNVSLIDLGDCVRTTVRVGITGAFVDAYSSHDRCALTLHEFLAARPLAHRIEPSRGVAFFRKA